MSTPPKVIVPATVDWPFLYPLVPALPAGPAAIYVPNIHEAFVNRQTANTRLITTNATYVIQEFLRAMGDRDDVRILATADGDVLAEHAPEILARRGPFSDKRIEVRTERTAPASARTEFPASYGETSPQRPGNQSREGGPAAPEKSRLAQAFRLSDPAARLALCIEELNEHRTAPALLATASTAMEVGDLDAAARDLEEAVALAPRWAAVHFEHGKSWLRRDDMARAADAFRRAATLLPAFTAAWANLGAALGELDRPEEALTAFETALVQDPANAQALNNVGVVRRELGKLDASEAAFRRVIELEPARAFGYYNLGHTLFLQGRFQAALSAYVEGQRRDRERNAVQATRLAMCRLATGDGRRALEDLKQAVDPLPPDYKRQLLADTQTIAWALLTHKPDLPGWKDVTDWLAKAAE